MTKLTDKKEKSAVPSVEKAFDILELVALSEDGLTINEMVEQLERTMGEIYRIIIYLTDRGYLSQNPDTNRYALTLKLFELSHRHDPTERLIGKSVPILERISSSTEQSCHLGVLNGDRVLVLASAASPRPAGYAVRTGAIFPADRTSSGYVILAHSAQSIQDEYLSRVPVSNRAQVAERLTMIRARGFEDMASSMIHGVRNLCVPVFDSRGVTAAITTGFISQSDPRTSAEQTLATLSDASQELSHSLGFRDTEDLFASKFDNAKHVKV